MDNRIVVCGSGERVNSIVEKGNHRHRGRNLLNNCRRMRVGGSDTVRRRNVRSIRNKNRNDMSVRIPGSSLHL